jgi:hypothetical protein
VALLLDCLVLRHILKEHPFVGKLCFLSKGIRTRGAQPCNCSQSSSDMASVINTCILLADAGHMTKPTRKEIPPVVMSQ